MRTSSLVTIVVGLAAATILGSIAVTPDPGRQLATEGPATRTGTATEGTATAQASESVRRRATDAETAVGPGAPTLSSAGPSRPGFDELTRRFIVLSRSAAERYERGLPIEAQSQAIDRLVETLEGSYPDAAERSVAQYAPEASTPDQATANLLFAQLIRRALVERLHELRPRAASPGAASTAPWSTGAGQTHDESRLDRLTRRLLSRLPESEESARFFGLGLLADQPFLGPGAESDLLALTELVSEQPFLASVLAELLRTLWSNMRASGARTPLELDALARLLANDPNPARRLAAASELFEHGDAGLRAVLVERARTAGDPELASTVARAAVDHLDPGEALEVITTLEKAIERPPVALLDQVAGRDPSVVLSGYEDRLATGHDAGLRRSLVSAMFADQGADAAEVARTALELDPDPGVLRNALLLGAARLPPSEALGWVESAWSDPRFGVRPLRIDLLASALNNLEGRAAPERLCELISRLQEDRACSSKTRRMLASLRSRIERSRE